MTDSATDAGPVDMVRQGKAPLFTCAAIRAHLNPSPWVDDDADDADVLPLGRRREEACGGT